MSKKTEVRTTSPEGDKAFVSWLARWAFITSVLIIAFDVAVFRNYPFPDTISGLRGPFYSIVGIVLLLACLAFGFLGYRVITTRYDSRTRDIYLLFLPPVLLVTSVVWLLLLAATG